MSGTGPGARTKNTVASATPQPASSTTRPRISSPTEATGYTSPSEKPDAPAIAGTGAATAGVGVGTGVAAAEPIMLHFLKFATTACVTRVAELPVDAP